MSSDMVRVICPHCRRVYDLAADVAAKRKKAQCGRCRKTFEIAGRAQPLVARAADVLARQATPPPIPPAAMAPSGTTPPPSDRPTRASFPPPGVDFDKAETLPPSSMPGGKPRMPETIRPGQPPPAPFEDPGETLDVDDILAESPDAFEPALTEGSRQRAVAKAESAGERASQNELELAALEISTYSLAPGEVRPRPSWLAHAEALLAAPPSTSAPPSA